MHCRCVEAVVVVLHQAGLACHTMLELVPSERCVSSTHGLPILRDEFLNYPRFEVIAHIGKTILRVLSGVTTPP